MQVTNYSCSVFVKRGEEVQRKVLYVSPVMGLERVRPALLLLMRQAYDRRAVKVLLRRDDVPSTPEEERQGKQAEAGVGSGASPSAGKSAKMQAQGRGQQDRHAKAGQTRRRPQQQPEAECMGQDEDSCDQLPVYSFAALGITGVAVGHGDYGSVVKVRMDWVDAVMSQPRHRHDLRLGLWLQVPGEVVRLSHACYVVPERQPPYSVAFAEIGLFEHDMPCLPIRRRRSTAAPPSSSCSISASSLPRRRSSMS